MQCPTDDQPYFYHQWQPFPPIEGTTKCSICNKLWSRIPSNKKEDKMIQSLRCKCIKCGDVAFFDSTTNRTPHNLAQHAGWRPALRKSVDNWKKILKGWTCPDCRLGTKKKFTRKKKSKFVRKQKPKFTRKAKPKFTRRKKVSNE